nr:TIGR03435 family protein [Granulicella sp. dw_53]
MSVAADKSPVFEVATIKPAAPSPDGHTHINYPADGGFSASNVTLLALMGWAYGMPERQILDGPSWLASARFDLKAKSDAETDSQLRSISSEQGRELKRRMVGALLAERCSVKLHQETRVLPAYDLVLAKGGSKLMPTRSNGKNVNAGRTYFNGQGLTAAVIAEQLSHITGRVVVDKTNLSDRYDLKLQWTPDDVAVGDDSAPSLFTAIQEQLGLKLESAKEPVPVMVIDHVELPSAN